MNVSAKSPWLPLVGALMTLAALPLCAEPTLKSDAPAQQAITKLLVSPTSLLPTGTKLLSLTITDGLATADFSREMKDNFRGGDTEDADAVNSILQTLGQFRTVSKVQILVEGHHLDSLGGLLVIADPLPVIRPAAVEPRRYLHRRTPAQSRTAKP